MTRLDYILCDPTGNITALVKSPLCAEAQPRAAGELMLIEPSVEQVGFLSEDARADIALRMAGGEFCGNASMSAAAVFAAERGLEPGGKMRASVSVSGAEKPVFVDVFRVSADSFDCRVEMPAPLEVRRLRLPLGGGEKAFTAAFIPGITHILLRERLERPAAEAAVKDWCARLDAPALGLMQLDEKNGGLFPLVYVPGADTLFWESSCASGTTAVGACLAFEMGKNISLSLKQPGGTLKIEVSRGENGEMRPLLSGSVVLGRETKHLSLEG